MKVRTWIKYEESYIPPRCRKPRYIPCEEYVDITLAEAKAEDLQLAFEDTSFFGAGKIFFYKKKLWACAKLRNPVLSKEQGINTPLEDLLWTHEHCSFYFRFDFDRRVGKDTSRKAVMAKAREDMQKYLLVDGVLYQQINEPRYCIYTFGLGHNHGGTSLSVNYGYNPNIPKDRYFSALQGDEAVAEANRIAAARGDTDSVDEFKSYIKVFMPELVKVNPRKQHGNGNSLLNTLDAIMEASPDKLTAGLLSIAAVGAAMNK